MIKKTVVITGASSGIGKEITNRLLDKGFRVIGISRTVCSEDFLNKDFIAINANLAEQKDLKMVCDRLKKESVYILINSAGFGEFRPHEELSFNTITTMTFLNLTTPMLLVNATLRSLKQNGGYIININSIEALRASKFAGVYSATKAGLKAFGDSLFEECRKTEVSITNINPDMTQTDFYNNLHFDVSDKDDEKLFASDIADAVLHILSMRKGAVVTDYTLRSLKFGIKKKLFK